MLKKNAEIEKSHHAAIAQVEKEMAKPRMAASVRAKIRKLRIGAKPDTVETTRARLQWKP